MLPSLSLLRKKVCAALAFCRVQVFPGKKPLWPHPVPHLRRGPYPCAGPGWAGPPAAASRARSGVFALGPFRPSPGPPPGPSPRLFRSGRVRRGPYPVSVAALSGPGPVVPPSVRCGLPCVGSPLLPSGVPPGPAVPRRCPPGPSPSGLRGRLAPGAGGLDAFAPGPVFFLACGARCASCFCRCAAACGALLPFGFSPAPLPSPPPPLGAPGKREAREGGCGPHLPCGGRQVAPPGLSSFGSAASSGSSAGNFMPGT